MRELIIFTYVITNKINNKQYVGMHATYNIDDGYMGSGLRLRNSMKKYGSENFCREILYYYEDMTIAHFHEGVLIRLYGSLCPNGYNLSPTGGLITGCGDKNPFYGKKHTDKTRQKISDRVAGRKQSESEIQHRAASLKGHPVSDETRRKIGLSNSVSQKGLQRSEESSRKKSEALKGVPWTEKRRLADIEYKEKIKLLGGYPKHSEEYRRHISEGRRDIPWSEGRKLSDHKRKYLLWCGVEDNDIPNGRTTRKLGELSILKKC